VSKHTQASKWIIHSERVIDDSRKTVLSVAAVELPDETRFEQYVLRVPQSATVVVLDERDRVLLLNRHRFVIDRWVWELPGGYMDPAELPEETAAREVLEETGWRPRSIERLGSFQPMTSMIDSENHLFLARGADDTGQARDINEAYEIDWMDLDEAVRLTETGEIVGAGSVVGLLKVAALRERERALS
jgi:8-oxo-dGTP pyrophosphatase MutT (NUDIX family)